MDIWDKMTRKIPETIIKCYECNKCFNDKGICYKCYLTLKSEWWNGVMKGDPYLELKHNIEHFKWEISQEIDELKLLIKKLK